MRATLAQPEGRHVAQRVAQCRSGRPQRSQTRGVGAARQHNVHNCHAGAGEHRAAAPAPAAWRGVAFGLHLHLYQLLLSAVVCGVGRGSNACQESQQCDSVLHASLSYLCGQRRPQLQKD